MEHHPVPLPALERLSTYIRCLMQLEHDGVRSISSHDMAVFAGVTAAQFRKDLSYFGEFGRRGIGYDVRDLRERIAQVLKIDKEQNVLLVGAGHLGSALIAYPGWNSYRFRIAAVFDRDPAKVGTTIRRLTVRDIAELESANAEIGAKIGILAVPAWEAQEVADRLISTGVTGLINFAPIRLRVPPGVVVREVCFICELAVLSHLVHHPDAGAAEPRPKAEEARRRRRSRPAASKGDESSPPARPARRRKPVAPASPDGD